MARFVDASTRCAPWVLWIWFKDGRNYETAYQSDLREHAEIYARNHLAEFDDLPDQLQRAFTSWIRLYISSSDPGSGWHGGRWPLMSAERDMLTEAG